MSDFETLQKKRAFSVSEASRYACVSRGTLEFWLMKGLLPYEVLPGTGDKQRFRRIRRNDLDKFLDGTLNIASSRAPKRDDNELAQKVFLIPKTT
jgi:hypothetical protein